VEVQRVLLLEKMGCIGILSKKLAKRFCLEDAPWAQSGAKPYVRLLHV
jgi:hypothetical protein